MLRSAFRNVTSTARRFVRINNGRNFGLRRHKFIKSARWTTLPVSLSMLAGSNGNDNFINKTMTDLVAKTEALDEWLKNGGNLALVVEKYSSKIPYVLCQPGTYSSGWPDYDIESCNKGIIVAEDYIERLEVMKTNYSNLPKKILEYKYSGVTLLEDFDSKILFLHNKITHLRERIKVHNVRKHQSELFDVITRY
jgi:hypothetical protein